MSNGLALDHWQDWAILVGIFGTLFTALGVIGTQIYNRRSSNTDAARVNLDQAAADDAASDRLIKLIEQEAEKKVALVRADFELAIANLKLDHAAQLTAMRADFDRQIADIRRDSETYHCDAAPTCKRRHRGAAEIKAGGTD